MNNSEEDGFGATALRDSVSYQVVISTTITKLPTPTYS